MQTLFNRTFLLSIWMLSLTFLAGCTENSTSSSKTADPKTSASQDASATDAPTEAGAKQASNWKLVFGQEQGMEIYEINGLLFKKPDSPQGETPEVLSNAAGFEIKGYDFSEQSAMIDFSQGGFELIFNGTLVEGSYYGTISNAENDLYLPARLVATSQNEIADNEVQVPPEGAVELRELTNQPSKPEAFRSLIKQYPRSMVVLAIYPVIIQRLTKPDEIVSTLKEYGDALKLYGNSYALTKLPDAAMGMLAKGVTPEAATQAVSYIRSVAGDLSTEELESTLITVEAISNAQSDQADQVDQGVKKLEELSEADPFNPITTVVLAESLLKKGETDRAFDYFSRLVALPTLLQPATMFASKGDMDYLTPLDHVRKIWTDKHNSLQGLQEHLDQVYEQHITWFAEQADVKDVEGTRQHVLIELFTGATCPPCVAADVALGGIEKSYSPDDLTILRYHMHIPGPDPMVAPSGQARFGMYGLQSTPSTLINGRMAPPMGGDVTMAPELYTRIMEIMESAIQMTTTVKLDATAEAVGDEVTIKANLEGLPANRLDELMLNAVLAENKVFYPAANGIRVHDMLVRAFLEPQPLTEKKTEEGEAPPPEQAAQASEDADVIELAEPIAKELTANLGQIQTEIIKGLDDSGKRMQHRFKDVPLDFDSLKVVVFVQSRKDGEILQTAVVDLKRTEAPTVSTRKKKEESKPESTEKPETEQSESKTPTAEQQDAAKPQTQKPEETKPESETSAESKPEESKPEQSEPETAQTSESAESN